ncbi:unnamed protein product [Meloidogyne enterolobii]|uniref:Uncharacterized protein n=2 Tax=Meloidogyne enterolobii TaxID=390850 RepID=A0ACB1B3A5_MELEN
MGNRLTTTDRSLNYWLFNYRIWLIGIGAGIGIGFYYIWRRDVSRSVSNKRRTLPIKKAACDEFVNLCEIPNDKESTSTEFASLALYNHGLKATENGDLKYRKSRDIARSVWNNRRAYPIEKTGTLSVLSDDSFITACDEFVNLCEMPSSDRESISTDFASLALYNDGLRATQNGDDFAAKLFGIRLAFRRLMDDPQTMQRLVQYGRIIMADLLRHDKRDPSEFYTAYDRMIAFITNENNMDTIRSELKSRKVESTNLWDTLFDLIILDAFEDLQRPPSAIAALVKNSFISKSMKESTLNNLIWSIIKVKRQRLQVKDGFISHFYDISQILTSSLAMGLFGGSDREFTELCIYLKEQIFGFILEIFNPNKVHFTKVEDLAVDIKKLLFDRMELLQKLMENLLTSAEFAFTKTKLSVQDQKSSYPKRNLFKGRDYGRLLKKVESREEMLTQLRNKDASKAEDVATKIAWEKAFQMASGLKVKDNPQLLMKGLKRKTTEKVKRKNKWISRKQALDEKMERKRQIKQNNLMNRASTSKRKKIPRKKRQVVTTK